MNQPTPQYLPIPQAPLQEQPPDDDFIDLRQLLRAILHHKWAIAGLALVVTLATAIVVSGMQPVYRASASLELEASQTNVLGQADEYAYDRYHYNYAQTQFEILKSRNLGERVARRLNLAEHPYFNPEPEEPAWWQLDIDITGFLRSLLPAPEQVPPVQYSEQEQAGLRMQALGGAVAGGLAVSPVEYSDLVYLSYESTSPQMAALLVNTIAEEFIARNLENRLDGTLQATDWLDVRLAELKVKLKESEDALQNFREQEGLVDVEGVTGLGGNELRDLSSRMQEATRARIEAQNIKEDVLGMTGASTAELMTVPAVLQHQLIRDLKREQSKVEREVAELAKRYGPRHPRMIAAQSDLSTANDELGREVRKVVSGINREYEVALRNEQQLRATWEARKSEMQDFNRTEFRLQELQREVDANRELYDIFFSRIKSVSETGGFEKPHARIVDRAVVPTAPVAPNKKLSVMLAFILATMLGCGLAVLLDMLDNTVKRPDDVRDKLGSNLLSTIPVTALGDHGFVCHTWEDPRSHFAEAVRTLRTSILLASVDEPGKVIVVTSTLPGEGKSTIALNLGSALGQMENTLVIGADLRRPSLASKCGLQPNHLGLSHFVAGTAELDDCIEYLDDLKLHIMPAGLVPPNPLEMISSRKFVDALNELRERFDRIILDSAPVQAVSDGLVLASYSDAVVYVVKADSTSATAAHRGIVALSGSNAPMAGVVLNQFNWKKTSHRYGTGKHDQYHDYYQSDDRHPGESREPVS